MSDTQVSQEQPVVDAPQTLDEVISEFNVEAAPTEPTKVPEFTPAQPTHLDPYDETSLNKWAIESQNQTAVLQQEIQNLKADATARTQADAQKIIDADIKSAVNVITGENGIDGLDPLSAEILLEKTARENEGFNQIWQNRAANPKAYEAALNAIVNENEGKFQRVDTQLAENHRAAQQSLQSNATQKATEYGNSYEEMLAKADNPNERAAIWERIKLGG